ncbi:MAG: hypothetical protein B7W97_01495 [Mycobacterium sp. 20-66-4]|nr:MAG: hypothetical protein B7W97_01495 [Mycobacterium sp. 20-66-4]
MELRRTRPYWGPRLLVFEMSKRGVEPLPSPSGAYRALLRAGMIDPSLRDRRPQKSIPVAADFPHQVIPGGIDWPSR